MALETADWKAIVAGLALLGGANIGNIWNATSPSVRADPFTGSDWIKEERALKAWVSAKVNRLEDRAEAHADEEVEKLERSMLRRFIRNEATFTAIAEEARLALSNDSACKEGLQTLKERQANCERRLNTHIQSGIHHRNGEVQSPQYNRSNYIPSEDH